VITFIYLAPNIYQQLNLKQKSDIFPPCIFTGIGIDVVQANVVAAEKKIFPACL
jgi:hypothetical protein